MPGKCDQCGVEEYMPYVCKFCRGRYCAAHRLPENHGCAGLGVYREKMRAEGRVMAPEPGVVRPEMSATARAGMSMDAFWSKVDGRMTYVFLGLMVATYVLEWVVALMWPHLFDDLFIIERDFLVQPWTLVTSIFAHSLVQFSHILFNGLVLLFFGATTERLIGTRRFTWLFLGAGIAGGIAQVILTEVIFDERSGGLGASGAIQGVMGTLVIIAPRLTVLVFFVIPAPLWALTIFYVLADLVGVITPGSGVGHFAHLAGLATGLIFGYYLRRQGLRTTVERPPPVMRRYF
ncbi:MAG TPA: rhomboid family intramembrane serine protease [Candidatus Thermoplasmatota archaeon]|nr:rhomboid family intramembrane serine protease [Candidatus Thermoplasmatota archaeon]